MEAINVDSNVYLLTLFVENLRRSLGISQQELAGKYEDILNSEIKELSNSLCSSLVSISNKDSKNLIGPQTKALFRTLPKRKIKLHQLLANAVEETKGSKDYVLSQSESEKCCKKLREHITCVVEPTTAGAASSNGGTELRSVREILNTHKKPNQYALKFLLSKCFAPLIVDKRYSTIIKKNLLYSKSVLVKSFFSYSKSAKQERYPLIDTMPIAQVLETILQAKKDLLSQEKPVLNNVQTDKQIQIFRSLLMNAADMLIDIECLPVSTFIEGESNEADDIEYSIPLGAKAKQNFYILVGEKNAKLAWNEISSEVFQITKQAIILSNDQINAPSIETYGYNTMVEVFFFYLFYTSPVIANAISRYKE